MIVYAEVALIFATVMTFLFGGWDNSMTMLTVLIVLDYITGVIKSFVNKTISSKTGSRGIAKKALIFIIIIIAVSLDRMLGQDQPAFRTVVTYFYIANEGISILENCIDLGLPVPAAIKNALEQITTKK